MSFKPLQFTTRDETPGGWNRARPDCMAALCKL
jgi:hypothetical protein